MRSAKDLFLEERETQSYEEFMHYPPKAKEKQELSLNSWKEKYERFLQNENKLLEIQRENHYLEMDIKNEFFAFGEIEIGGGSRIALNKVHINEMWESRTWRYLYADLKGSYSFSSQKDKGETINNLVRIINPFYRDIKK